MKGLRVFLIVIISILLVFLISFVTIVSTVKKNIEGEIIKIAVKETIKSEIPEVTDEQIKEIDEILSYEGVSDLIDTALDEYVKYINGESTGISDETIDTLFDFIREYESDIEKVIGEDIDISKIDTPENRSEFKETVDKGLKEIKIESGNEVNKVVKTYANITSKKFLTEMICLICGLIVLIGLLSWSLYKWMLPVGIVFIITGVISGILFAVSAFANKIIESSSNMPFSLDYTVLLICFLCELIGGIVLIVVQNIINKKVINKNDSVVYSN